MTGLTDIAIPDPPIVQKAGLTMNVFEITRHLIANPKGQR
jgi:hypothetical protein